MLAEYALCVVGIYSCFLTWGVLQERVSTTPYGDPNSPDEQVRFRSFIVLNLCQATLAALVGAIYLLIVRGQSLGPRSPRVLAHYAGVALLNSLASPFGYAALRYIDYPTMILGKSCKLLPVMAMSVLVHRARFPKHQYLAVALVTAGVSAFMLLHDQEGKKGSKNAVRSNSLWGLFLLSVNLAIDGLTNSTQDAMIRKFSITGQQMMVMMNLAAALLMLVYLAIPQVSSNELSVALSFIRTHPAVLKDILLFSAAGALGQVFIFHTLGRFGSLSLVTITVTRKMFSIILSVVMYNHHLSLGQWGAVLVVFGGIAIESYGKKLSKKKHAHAAVPSTGKGAPAGATEDAKPHQSEAVKRLAKSTDGTSSGSSSGSEESEPLVPIAVTKAATRKSRRRD